MTRRRIIYLSGTRADFGLMRHALEVIAADPRLDLSVAVTGMHLHEEFGHTVDEIAASGLRIAAQIRTSVAERNRPAMARAVGHTLMGLTNLLETERPDALLLLGDRGEMLAGAIAALHLGVPAVHIHGGERSGTVDEPMRHAISKIAAYHFCATLESRERLIAMGEAPDRVFQVGAPGLDDLPPVLAAPREAALEALGLTHDAPYVLVLFHPVVQEAEDAAAQTASLIEGLRAAGAHSAFDVVWLAPNADAGSDAILQELAALIDCSWRRITHLPRARYLLALRHAAALLGNSSSGIIEAASFGTPVVNVGRRQHLRERNSGTVDAGIDPEAISAALRSALNGGRPPVQNIYGDGQAAGRINELLATLPLFPDLLNKANRY